MFVQELLWVRLKLLLLDSWSSTISMTLPILLTSSASMLLPSGPSSELSCSGNGIRMDAPHVQSPHPELGSAWDNTLLQRTKHGFYCHYNAAKILFRLQHVVVLDCAVQKY